MAEIKDYEQFEKKLSEFIGYIGQPELKYFESGAIKCTFAIPLKKKKEDTPVWLNCVSWGHLAEEIASKAPKGTLMTVRGYFKEEEGKDGKKYLTFTVCNAGW